MCETNFLEAIIDWANLLRKEHVCGILSPVSLQGLVFTYLV